MNQGRGILALLVHLAIIIHDGSSGPALWDGQCAAIYSIGYFTYSPSNYNGSANTPALCITACKKSGFSFAGVYKTVCRCAEHAVGVREKTYCYAKCPGNPDIYCGAHDTGYAGKNLAMNIYSTGKWSISYSGGQRELNSSLIASIPHLGKEWRVNHEFQPSQYLDDFSDGSTASSLYLTAGDNNETVVAISFHPSYGMRVEYDANGNTFFENVPAQYLPKINRFMLIDISQELLDNRYMILVGLDAVNILKVENKIPREFTNVRLFSGDPSRLTQPGFIKDVHVLTKTEESIVRHADCCNKMTVDGITYKFEGTGDMTGQGCKYDCVYTSTKAGDSNKYCFAAGDFALQCGA